MLSIYDLGDATTGTSAPDEGLHGGELGSGVVGLDEIRRRRGGNEGRQGRRMNTRWEVKISARKRRGQGLTMV